MRLPALAVASALAVAVLSACGGESTRDPAETGAAAEVDEATAACREQWRALADDAEDERADATGTLDPDGSTPPPSALTSRWVSVEATLAYYASSASTSDCEDTLSDQRAAIEVLAEFAESLQPFDAEYRLVQLQDDDGLAGYQRPAGRAGRDVPAPAEVTAALETLAEQAPRTTTEQEAAWQQALVTDLRDQAARERALADLRLLSQESAAWRRSAQAIQLLERAAAEQAD